ncbi:MAG TPA: folate-binding protein [Lichenihabitans sp.]|jgi:hypothetical protein|nr:folate-binding protein [Lichenihabitans sp.]
MTGVLLEDRGIVEVAGLEAGELLQRLVTNDVLGLVRGEARYAALLTPQGKIVVDFLVAAAGEASFLIDCPRHLAADVARKLTLYRLRARVTITDRSAELRVAAFWPEAPSSIDGLVVRDPRHPSLGYRAVASHAALADLVRPADREAYTSHRIDAGVPEGGTDFAYGDAFPHDANLDLLNGIDFGKGCYVGQEVVSRVQHRGTARKRIRPVIFEGAPPPAGTEVVVGEIAIGTMGSAVAGRGLAMVRVDRAAEAAALGAPASAAGVHLSIALG